MQLVEKHTIKKTHSFYKELEQICFQTKNIYNSLNYIIRQEYFINQEYIGFNKLYHTIKKDEIWNKCGLPKKVCNQIVKIADQNYKSYFAAIKAYNSDPSNFKAKPKIPSYKDSVKGRVIAIYEKGALYQLVFKKTGKLRLSDTNISIKTQ